jgi:DNA polymerase-3 subunit epsilon
MTRGQDALLIDEVETGTVGAIVTRVDLRQFTLPVLLASEQEAAAHEEVLKQLDKASGGKTVWRQGTISAVA